MKKFKLNKETLRRLDATTLHHVAGADSIHETTCEFSACGQQSCEVGTSCVHCIPV